MTDDGNGQSHKLVAKNGPEVLSDIERELLDERYHGQIKQGYYIGFEETGVPAVDRLLAALGHAGKGYHHTEMWNEELEYGTFAGSSYADVIQRAANEAAEEIRTLAAQAQRTAAAVSDDDRWRSLLSKRDPDGA